jgi:hypothetical protein
VDALSGQVIETVDYEGVPDLAIMATDNILWLLCEEDHGEVRAIAIDLDTSAVIREVTAAVAMVRTAVALSKGRILVSGGETTDIFLCDPSTDAVEVLK